jgi:hypothetical protein
MLRLLFWLFVLFLALSYLNISIESILHSPAGQANLHYLAELALRAYAWIAAHVPALSR